MVYYVPSYGRFLVSIHQLLDLDLGVLSQDHVMVLFFHHLEDTVVIHWIHFAKKVKKVTVFKKLQIFRFTSTTKRVWLCKVSNV